MTSALASSAPSRWLALLVVVPLAIAGVTFLPVTEAFFFADDLLYQAAHEPLPALLTRAQAGHMLTTSSLVTLILYQVFGPIRARSSRWRCLRISRTSASRSASCGPWRGARSSRAPRPSWGRVAAARRRPGVARRLRTAAGRRRDAPRAALAAARGGGRGAARLDRRRVGGAARDREHQLRARRRRDGRDAGRGVAAADRRADRGRVGLAMLAASVAGIAVYVGVLTMAPATSGAGQAGALRDALQAWVGVLEPTARLVAFGLRQLMLGPFADHVPRFAAEPFAAGAVLLATGWVVATPPRRRAQALACAALALACYGSIAMERVVFQPHLGARLAESEPYHYAATLPLTMRVALAVAAAACTRVRGRIALAAPGCWLLAWCAGHQLAGRRIPATWPSVSSRSRRANRSVAVAATQPVGADVYVRNEPFRGVGPLLVSAPLQFPA